MNHKIHGIVTGETLSRPYYVEREATQDSGFVYAVRRALKSGVIKTFDLYKTERGAINRCAYRNIGFRERGST